MTQNELIKRHLEKFGSITSLEAFVQHGCLRLSARIHNLRETINIKTEYVTKNNKTFAKYILK